MSETREFPPYTEEHHLFRQSVREWAKREIAPHWEEWEEEESFPKELFKQAGDQGYLGIRWSPESGGLGLDYWYTLIFVEELVKSGLSIGVCVSLLVQCEMASGVYDEYGTAELKELVLRPAIAGDAILALGVSEPNAGSDVAALRTTARHDGDDYVIDGSKTFISNGTRADFITLAVRTGGDGPRGVSLVAFPTDTPGFSVSRKLPKKMSKCSDLAELFFENCRIPRHHLIGEEGHGFYYIMRLFQGERLVLACMAQCVMEMVYERCLEYARDRNVFGTPLSKMQVWRHRFADAQSYMAASRALLHQATDELSRKSLDGDVTVSQSKLVAAELCKRWVPELAQVLGGYALIDEGWVPKNIADVFGFGIGAGTSEIMREIIAKRTI